MISFASYHLDLEEERLWKGDKLLALRRKPFAILRHLASNPKRLVTHQELLQEVWDGAVVSESAVRSHLHDLRQVLGEGVIETVIGRGYRFVADLAASAPAPSTKPASTRPQRLVVGRDAELRALRTAYDRAAGGHRQVAFVSGDPGMGKTTLVDAFLDELEDRGVLAVRGHCIEQFGTPEAYLAMIEVIGKLRRSERGDQIIAAFARYAPTFIAQVPHLIPDELQADVARRAQGGNDARMVRELVEALEVACGQDPIVIVLEDLQWSDVATIDLLAVLCQRTERAKLLLIGTSRRAAIQTADHPLSRVVKNLVARSGATSIALDRIGTEPVRELVARRFPDHAFPPKLIEVISGITGGTPLFLVTLLDDLVGRGMIAQRDDRWVLTVGVDEVAAHRPDSIKQLIDIQLDRLTTDEQRMLEAASLVGAVFDTASVAAALELSAEQVDDRCENLERRGLFLRREASEETPDGSVVSRYAVTHALVQEVCEERGSLARRQRWHLAIARHLERSYASGTDPIAHVLAAHYEKAGASARAIEYYIIAGHQTSLRFASVDAVASYERARALLPKIPRTPERDAIELKVLAVIGQLLIRTPYSGGDPLETYERALELARETGDIEREYAGLASLCLRRAIHSELDLALRVGEEMIAAEARHVLPPMLVEYGRNVRAFYSLYRGDIATGLEMFESLLDDSHRASASETLIHPTSMLGPIVRTAVSRGYSALAHCLRGAPDRALRAARLAVEEATRLNDRIALGTVENLLARIHFERRDPVAQIEQAALAVLNRGTAGWVVMYECRLIAAWAAAQRTPITAAAAEVTVSDYRARLAMLSLSAPNVAPVIAGTLWSSGHRTCALDVIELAIEYAEAHHELLYLPDCLRVRGEYRADPVSSRQAYDRALELGMPLVALRAATTLGDRVLISTALERCTEPGETPDFIAARAALVS